MRAELRTKKSNLSSLPLARLSKKRYEKLLTDYHCYILHRLQK